MTQSKNTVEKWVVEQRWNLTYRHTADAAAAMFFSTLRDHAKLLGTRCPVCSRVLVPPRSFCDRDFCETEGYVEVAPEGTIELFTIVYHRIQDLPEPPYAIAYVRPDGGDTAVVNFVRGLDFSDRDAALSALAIGSRVSVRFAELREGRMTDFWFEVTPAH